MHDEKVNYLNPAVHSVHGRFRPRANAGSDCINKGYYQYGNICGYIIEDSTNKIIRWVDIKIMKIEGNVIRDIGTTHGDRYGYYSTKHLPVGNYLFSVWKKGYHEKWELLSIRPDDIVINHFVLKPGKDTGTDPWPQLQMIDPSNTGTTRIIPEWEIHSIPQK